MMSVLDVAVEYRLRDMIRKLMKLNEEPTPLQALESDHLEEFRKPSRSIRLGEPFIPDEEANFACYLA